jgi:TrmH family RNA methyltransferase
LALAEGVRLVEEVLAAGVECRAVVVSPALSGTERGRALKAALESAGPVAETTDNELAQLAATEHPQGVVAVIVPKRWTLDDIVIGPSGVVAVLDGLQDPGNVGTIVRTALALGGKGVVTLPGTADLENPKTLRSAMGATFRLPALRSEEGALREWLDRHQVTVAATAMEGQPFDRARLTGPLALVFGNEGAGLTSDLGRNAKLAVSIPLEAGAESLNVAVAAGIFLYGACRDR